MCLAGGDVGVGMTGFAVSKEKATSLAQAQSVVRRRVPAPRASGFGAEVALASDRGLVSVSALHAGDRLRLADGSFGEVAVCLASETPAGAKCLRIPAGALGPGVPSRDLVIPVGQRLRVNAPILARLCGAPAALIEASQLAGISGVREVASMPGLRYHLLMDRPALLPVMGFAAEPFVPDGGALAALDASVRGDLLRAFPRMRYPGAADGLRCGLPDLTDRELAVATAGGMLCVADRGGSLREGAADTHSGQGIVHQIL